MDENMMKQFAPALVGMGLLASIYWFADTSRRPKGFGGMTLAKSRKRRRKSRR
jgi:hypothetical protein